MSRNARGKREVGRREQQMTRGQKIRRRVLLVLLVLVGCIGVGAVALSAWIRVPSIPGPHPDGSGSAENLGESGTAQANPEQMNGAGSEYFEEAETPNISLSGRREGVYTFLVAGRDVASGSTDVMLLLNYDTKGKTVSGLSLPRDTMMDVGTASKRLNAVFNNNKGKDEKTQTEKGMAALKESVRDLTGILPDYYVYVQWEAIGELVDAIGGVEFKVPFNMDYDDPYQDLHIHQKAGLRKLTGEDAMQVVRWRKNSDGTNSGGGDITRISIQQDFLKAVAKKCLTPTLFFKLPDLVEIFKENVETDLTVGNILALAQKAYGMNPDTSISFETAPIGALVMYNGASMVTLDPDGMLEIVNEKINPYLRDVEKSDLHMLIRSGKGYTVTSGKINKSIVGGRNSSVTPTTIGPESGSTTGSTAGTTGSSTTRPGTGSTGGGTTRPSTGSTGSGTTRPGTGSTGSGTTRPSTGSTGSGTTRPGSGSTGSGTARPGTGSTGSSTTGSGTGSTGTSTPSDDPEPEEPDSGTQGGDVGEPQEPDSGSGDGSGLETVQPGGSLDGEETPSTGTEEQPSDSTPGANPGGGEPEESVGSGQENSGGHAGTEDQEGIGGSGETPEDLPVSIRDKESAGDEWSGN